MIRTVLSILLLPILICCTTNSAQSTAEKSTTEVKKEIVNFNADSCYAMLKAQVDFGPRVPGSKAHNETSSYLQSVLKNNGAEVVVQKESAVTAEGKTIPVYNILGRYNVNCNNRILLLAHWDTRPWADEDKNAEAHNTPIDGANDGASGVSVLLEISRLIKNNPLEDIGIDILLVDAEDSGKSEDESSWCLGTQLWVKNMPYTSQNKPKYAILLDMVGGREAKFHREYFSNLYARDVVNRVWSIATASGYGNQFVNEPGGAITDDHLVIMQSGIPAIDIIENKNPETGSFNPTWHTLDDNLQNIDKTTLKAVGQVITNCIYTKNIK